MLNLGIVSKFRGFLRIFKGGIIVSNLTPVEVVNILACIAMMFFWGLQIEASEKVQNLARVFWLISLIVVWICIFLR